MRRRCVLRGRRNRRHGARRRLCDETQTYGLTYPRDLAPAVCPELALSGSAVGRPKRLLLTVDLSCRRAAFTTESDPYRKSRLLTDGRCHVAKYWGRKTYIALNRSRGSPLVEALAVKWHHPGQRQSAAFYSMPYGISRASFHVPSGCLLTMSVAVPAHTLASPDDETVLDFHSTTTSARSSPAEMILRTSNSRSGLYENVARNISRNSTTPRAE